MPLAPPKPNETCKTDLLKLSQDTVLVAQVLQRQSFMQRAIQKLFPVPAIAALMAIGFIDLISTAVLHSHGLITELNPLMKPLIETSEWLFVAVKGATLVLAWLLMLKTVPSQRAFVNRAAWIGCALYASIWTVWFFAAS